MPRTLASFIRTTLIIGFLLNATGWIGNAIVLHGEWQAALADTFTRPRVRSAFGEVMTLLPDFIYAACWVWLYRRLTPEGSSRRVAVQTGLLVWAVGAATTYVGIASAQLLPVRISMLSAALALVIFVAFAPLLARLDGRPEAAYSR